MNQLFTKISQSMKKTKIVFGISLLISMLTIQSCNDDEVSTATVSGLDCSGATFSTTATTGSAYTGTVTIPYTGGNGIAYSAGSGISSTGVSGLTATLSSGTLTNGSGSATYTITGTPDTTGSATFPITLGGQTCNLVLPVNAAAASITGLTCTGTTYSAEATGGTAYTGTATVPYTGGNASVYTAGTAITSTGVTGMTATLQAGTLASGTGNLTYTITGTPSAAGTATFPVAFGGQTCNMTMTIK